MRARSHRADRRVRPRHPPTDRAGARRRDQGVPELAGRRQLHVPRLPRVRPGRRRAIGPLLGADRGLRARHPSRLPASRRRSCQPQGGGVRPSAADPAADQGQLAFARAPPRVPRLHRRQEVRRGRPRDRRAPLPRPLHDAPPTRRALDRSRSSGQGQGRTGAGRLPAGQPRPQGADRDPRVLPARLAVPDGERRPVRRRDRASSASASASACGCSYGATRSSDSWSAWCASRATASTPRTASGSDGS